jgi:hypothetical protein
VGIFDKAEKIIRSKVQKLKDDTLTKEFKSLIGELAKTTIYKRVKAGYGVDDDSGDSSDRAKLASLAETTIKQRKGELKFFTNKKVKKPYAVKGDGKLSFTPGFGFKADRSNLTQSGEMLESIKVSIGEDIILEIPSTSRKDGQINSKIAIYNAEGDPRKNRPPRPFFALTVAERRILVNALKKELEKNARNI